MPRSGAPLVVEQRSILEESLRHAVLASGDAEALLLLAELWEAALEALPENDPRRALVLARVKRLREDWGI